jgi:hypothetical protein
VAEEDEDEMADEADDMDETDTHSSSSLVLLLSLVVSLLDGGSFVMLILFKMIPGSSADSPF